jgi:adenosylhomocysteine nucleosidase
MVGVVYATRREADPFLSQLSVDSLTAQPFLTFQTTGASHPSCITVISGMGKVAATMAATQLVLVQRVSVLISAGLCGRLIMDNGWSVGDLFRIDTAVESDCDRFGHAEQTVTCDARWFGELKAARLVTQDRPVFDATRRGQLADIGDLADMEGAAVARVAKLYGIPCAMIKGISDVADENGRQDVTRHIDWVSGRIADALSRELSINPTDGQP